MTTPIEDLLLNELTPHYVAKNIAPYLQITVPEPPQVLLDLLSQQPEAMTVAQGLEIYDITLQTDGRAEADAFLRAFNDGEFNLPAVDEKAAEQEYQREQQKENEFMAALDLYTQPEKDAYTVACYAGMALRRLIRADCQQEGIDVVGKGKNLEIIMAEDVFERYLSLSIADGMNCLEGNYWMPLKDVEKPEIINSDFKDKAVEWLKKELYLRIAHGKECYLLDKVIVKKNDEDKILMRDKKKASVL